MENSQSVLARRSDEEKGAYLGAIASIATADRQASDEDVKILRHCAMPLKSPVSKKRQLKAATNIRTKS